MRVLVMYSGSISASCRNCCDAAHSMNHGRFCHPCHFGLQSSPWLGHARKRGGSNVRLLTQILLVSIGSTIGGLARWGVSAGCARLLGNAFPWGTLIINLSGSLILGWFSTYLSDRMLAAGGNWW